MRLMVAAAAALALAACGQSAQQEEAAAPADPAAYSGPNNCAASAERVWIRANGADYKVDAATNGADCASAIATLHVRGPENVVLHEFSAPVRNLIGLREATDPAAMQAAVTEWLNQTPPLLETSGGLPDWREASMQPEIESEFRFYPETGTTRDQYMAVRTARAPMFCYAQGRESLACVVLESGAVRKFGMQQVPG